MIARADDPAGALAAGESAIAEFLDRLLGGFPGQERVQDSGTERPFS